MFDLFPYARSEHEARSLAKLYREAAIRLDKRASDYQNRTLKNERREAGFKAMFRAINATLYHDLNATMCRSFYHPHSPNHECVKANFKRIQINRKADFRRERNAKIVRHSQNGVKQARIADMYGLTRARVSQIISAADKS